MLRLKRPSDERLRALAEQGRAQTLTYAPVGVTGDDSTPAGYRRDRWSRQLGNGALVFDRAAEAIRTWQVHRGAGLQVFANGPPTEGQVVAMSSTLPVGHIEVVCRVVGVVSITDRFGFAYGTLPVHPERGEESFVVERSDDGSVRFVITAVSRPRHPLARLGGPLARRLQRAATERYLDAMTVAVG